MPEPGVQQYFENGDKMFIVEVTLRDSHSINVKRNPKGATGDTHVYTDLNLFFASLEEEGFPEAEVNRFKDSVRTYLCGKGCYMTGLTRSIPPPA
ncbi:MAG: hypothetical protein ACRCZE_02420 [Candidatus Altimarinota bacterium]